MNLVTKCPSCYTSFIIKPEQLESHHGQVRCGQCQHVFIARDNLNEQSPPENFLQPLKHHTHKTKSPLVLGIYIALIILALVQTVFFMRSSIVNQWPALKPFYTNVCHSLGCTLTLPHHAELIALDDTELIKDDAHQDIIKFNCLILNNAPYAQSFPTIELTLTDKQDMPLVRRKVTPKEYLNGSSVQLNDGLAGNDEIHVSINLKTSGLAVAGFRAFAIY